MTGASAVLLLFAALGCDETLQPAGAALERGDLNGARSVLNAAKRQCSDSAFYNELSGVLSDRSGDLVAAEESFRKAALLAPRSARLFAELGITCLRNQKVTEAVEALEQSVRLDSSDSRVVFTLGMLLAKQGAYPKAVEYLRLIPDRDADDAAYFNLGLAYSHLGDFDNARRAYFGAIDKHPYYVEAYFHIAVDYITAGEPRKAIPWLFRANDLSAGRTDIVYALTEQLIQLQYVATAEEVLNTVLEKNPVDPVLTLASADVDRERKNSNAAAAKYERALEQQPRLAAAYVGLARLAISEGKEREARGYLLQALNIDPEDPPANGQLGILESHQANWSGALARLEKAWSKDRSNPLVGLELARAIRHNARLRDALKLMKSLEPKLRDSAPFQLELAQLYGQLRRPADAQAARATVASLEAKAHQGLRFEESPVYVH
jgi:tetratricopeptide (TPR) repeat protein